MINNFSHSETPALDYFEKHYGWCHRDAALKLLACTVLAEVCLHQLVRPLRAVLRACPGAHPREQQPHALRPYLVEAVQAHVC